MNDFISILITTKNFNRNIIFSICLKAVMAEAASRGMHSLLEKFLDNELIRAQNHNLTNRLRILTKLKNNMQALKMGLRAVIFGTLAPQDLSPFINGIMAVLKMFSKEKSAQLPLKDIGKDPNSVINNLPKIIANNTEKVKNPGIDIKVPVGFKLKRECEIIKHYIQTQPELLKEFEKAQLEKVSVKDRITNYCTTQVNSMIKKLVANIRRQPVVEGLRTVKAQSDKVLRTLNTLPQDSSKFVDLTNDLLFSMKVLDTYTKILRKDANVENIAYFKEYILPDLFVILTAIHKEAKK
jgi:cell fate (sporulation/competence/biofilm development) regulator YmcA (YheA/YmcA/DUF963 family)